MNVLFFRQVFAELKAFGSPRTLFPQGADEKTGVPG
jgi:hypothetical protein